MGEELELLYDIHERVPPILAIQMAKDLEPYRVSDKPGLGIDLDEKLAGRFPIQDDPSLDMFWGNVRRRAGTIVTP
ncbi:MAG: hypothetical protein ACE15E_08115 [Acidobacteriota bacterium]